MYIIRGIIGNILLFRKFYISEGIFYFIFNNSHNLQIVVLPFIQWYEDDRVGPSSVNYRGKQTGSSTFPGNTLCHLTPNSPFYNREREVQGT